MAKTREQLLAMADECTELAYQNAASERSDLAEIATALAQTAQACVMLAKELRESVEPVVEIDLGQFFNAKEVD